MRWRDLSFAGRLTVFINDFGFDDVEDLLRVYISACFTLPAIAVDLEGGFFKIGHGLYRGAVIRGVAAGIHNDHLVKHFINVRRGLVDDDEDQFTLEREFF